MIEGIKTEVKNQFLEKKDLLATRQDIYELRLDMKRGFKNNLKWKVATMLVVAGLIIAAIKVL